MKTTFGQRHVRWGLPGAKLHHQGLLHYSTAAFRLAAAAQMGSPGTGQPVLVQIVEGLRKSLAFSPA